MSLFEQYKTDENLEAEGVWFQYPQPDGSIAELRLARAGGGNTAYKREMTRLLRIHSRKGSLNVPIDQYPPALNQIIDAMAHHILKDWRTVVNGKTKPSIKDLDGKWLPYNQDNAKALLRMTDMRLDIQVKAGDFSNYQDDGSTEVEIEGNSSPPSSGT